MVRVAALHMTTRAGISTVVTSQHQSRFRKRPASRLELAITARLNEQPVRERQRIFNPHLHLSERPSTAPGLGASASLPSLRPATSNLNRTTRYSPDKVTAALIHPQGRSGQPLSLSFERHRPLSGPASTPPLAGEDGDAQGDAQGDAPIVPIRNQHSDWTVLAQAVCDSTPASAAQPLRSTPSPRLASLAPLGYAMPRAIERACDSFDQKSQGIMQRLSTLKNRLEEDVTSERVQLKFDRALAELRIQRLQFQPHRWRDGYLQDNPLSHGGFLGSRHPRAPPRNRPVRSSAALGMLIASLISLIASLISLIASLISLIASLIRLIASLIRYGARVL